MSRRRDPSRPVECPTLGQEAPTGRDDSSAMCHSEQADSAPPREMPMVLGPRFRRPHADPGPAVCFGSARTADRQGSRGSERWLADDRRMRLVWRPPGTEGAPARYPAHVRDLRRVRRATGVGAGVCRPSPPLALAPTACAPARWSLRAWIAGDPRHPRRPHRSRASSRPTLSRGGGGHGRRALADPDYSTAVPRRARRLSGDAPCDGVCRSPRSRAR